MSALRTTLAAIVTAGFTAMLVVCSQIPYEPDTRETALVRLSWRAVGDRLEECRAPTQEELDALPLHMRPKEICGSRLTPFALSVSLDGVAVYSGQIRASGAREDRPTYVFHQFEVAPGTHRLSVRFAPDREGSASAPLVLDETVTLAPREVLLVTQDSDSDQLIVFTPAL